MKIWSKWTPNDSFGFCSSRGFQYTPYMLNLMIFFWDILCFRCLGILLMRRIQNCLWESNLTKFSWETSCCKIREITAILIPSWDTLKKSWLWIVVFLPKFLLILHVHIYLWLVCSGCKHSNSPGDSMIEILFSVWS